MPTWALLALSFAFILLNIRFERIECRLDGGRYEMVWLGLLPGKCVSRKSETARL